MYLVTEKMQIHKKIKYNTWKHTKKIFTKPKQCTEWLWLLFLIPYCTHNFLAFCTFSVQLAGSVVTVEYLSDCNDAETQFEYTKTTFNKFFLI